MVQGIPSQQHDAWNIGMTTTDDFTQAEVYPHHMQPHFSPELISIILLACSTFERLVAILKKVMQPAVYMRLLSCSAWATK